MLLSAAAAGTDAGEVPVGFRACLRRNAVAVAESHGRL